MIEFLTTYWLAIGSVSSVGFTLMIALKKAHDEKVRREKKAPAMIEIRRQR